MSELETIQLGSLTVLTLLFVLCVFGIKLSSSNPAARLLVFIIGSTVVFVVGWFAWFTLIYAQTVPLDRTLAKFGIYQSEIPVWVSVLVFLVPSLIPVLALVGVFFYARLSETKQKRW